jgi:hypothetical protein
VFGQEALHSAEFLLQLKSFRDVFLALISDFLTSLLLEYFPFVRHSSILLQLVLVPSEVLLLLPSELSTCLCILFFLHLQSFGLQAEALDFAISGEPRAL